MQITKLGHCCLLIEENGLRILTDPGAYSQAQNEIRDIHLILITHEHQDHYDPDSLRTVMRNNPPAKIYTNRGVSKLLASERIEHHILEHGEYENVRGVLVEGFGEKHAEIYPSVKPVVNTGYRIAQKLYLPGDAFFEPKRPVDVLALPVCGPWMRIADAIDFAKEIRPRVCFPVHDGMLSLTGGFHKWPQEILPGSNIQFQPLAAGETADF